MNNIMNINISQLEQKLLKITDTYIRSRGDKIETTRLDYWPSIYNAYDKSKNRINNILEQIKKQINKKQFDKKYQIRSNDEFKIIEDFCIQNNLKYKFLIDRIIYHPNLINDIDQTALLKD